MRITRRTAVIVAVVCAAGAALLIVIYLQSLKPKTTSAPQVETVAVPVSKAALPAGTLITADQLASKDLPRDKVPAEIMVKPEELIGQKLAVDLPAGQPFTHASLAAFSPQAGMAFVVPNGMRAVTVAVDNITGVSGFLKLGDRVDVLATFEASGGAVTRTVMQDVQVLGLGTEGVSPRAPETKPAATGGTPAAGGASSDQPQPPRPSATLSVTPEQAQVLVMSAIKGRLHLALRPKSDSRMVALPPTTNTAVVGVSLAPPPPAGGASSNPASQAVGAMGTAGARAGAGLSPAGSAGGAPGAPGGAAGPAAPTGPTVEVFKGSQRELVTPQGGTPQEGDEPNAHH